MWDDVIGEPEGIRSTECAWNCSYKCFRGTKNCCYLLLATLFAPCLAFCSAINFACLAFQVGSNVLKAIYLSNWPRSKIQLKCLQHRAMQIQSTNMELRLRLRALHSFGSIPNCQ